MGHQILPIAFFARQTPVATASKFGTKLVIICLRQKFLSNFCIYKKVFEDGLSNAANRIFPRPTSVVMATKIGIKLAITRLAYKIFAKFLRM